MEKYVNEFAIVYNPCESEDELFYFRNIGFSVVYSAKNHLALSGINMLKNQSIFRCYPNSIAYSMNIENKANMQMMQPTSDYRAKFSNFNSAMMLIKTSNNDIDDFASKVAKKVKTKIGSNTDSEYLILLAYKQLGKKIFEYISEFPKMIIYIRDFYSAHFALYRGTLADDVYFDYVNSAFHATTLKPLLEKQLVSEEILQQGDIIYSEYHSRNPQIVSLDTFLRNESLSLNKRL